MDPEVDTTIIFVIKFSTKNMIRDVGFLFLRIPLTGLDVVQLIIHGVKLICEGGYGIIMGVNFLVDN